MFNDLRFAIRQLLKNPGFTAVTVLTMGLGIATVTVVFSLIDTLYFHALSVRELSRLHDLFAVPDPGSDSYQPFSYPDYADYRDRNDVFEGLLAQSSSHVFNLRLAAGIQTVSGAYVSGNYFSVLGLQPSVGRFFSTDEDAVPGRNPVAVISQALWRAQFHQSPDAVGRTIELNGQAYTIIAVAPGGFHGTAMPSKCDVWVPLTMISTPSWLESRGTGWLAMTGRLKPGVSRRQAEAALSVIGNQIKTAHSKDFMYTRFKCLRVGTSFMTATPGAVRLVLMLAAGALLFLLVACTNVMGMLLARATTRLREMAIRASIGATRKRLLRLLLTENIATFALAGMLAIFLVYWSRPALESMLAITPYFKLTLVLDWRTFAFALGLSAAAGLLCVFVPALAATRGNVAPLLKDAGLPGGLRPGRARQWLVGMQQAVSLLLLVISGLFYCSAKEAQKVHLGFEPNNVRLLGVNARSANLNREQQTVMYQRFHESLKNVPALEGYALAAMFPTGGSYSGLGVSGRDLEGYEPRSESEFFNLRLNAVSPGYFQTLRVPLRAGRDFQDTDRPGGPQVAIISESFARRIWPEASPLGKKIRRPDGSAFEIVGVAGDVRYQSLTEDGQHMVYVPFTQAPGLPLTLLTRAKMDLNSTSRLIARELEAIDARLLLENQGNLLGLVRLSFYPQRRLMGAAGTVSALGVVIAAVGLYAALLFLVSQQTREIGIRMALGADGARVFRRVFGQGMKLALAGSMGGLMLALCGARLVQSFFFAVSAWNPAVFLVTAGTLFAVAILACWLPASRAARIDPMEALRYE